MHILYLYKVIEHTALADGEVMQGGLLRNLLAVDKNALYLDANGQRNHEHKKISQVL